MTTRDEFPPLHVAIVNNIMQTLEANKSKCSVIGPHKDVLGHSQALARNLHRNARVDHAFFAFGAPNVLCNVAVKCHGCKLRYCEMCIAKCMKKRMQSNHHVPKLTHNLLVIRQNLSQKSTIFEKNIADEGLDVRRYRR